MSDRVIDESPKLKALKQALEEISEDKDETINEINLQSKQKLLERAYTYDNVF